jgi:hypothetical protein
MVCGDPQDPDDPYYGYTPGVPDVLKTSTTNGNWEVGPGNFQLVRLDGFTGGADIRRSLAGDFDACVGTNDDIETEPGNTVGPVVQGLNTRFGIYAGPMGGQQANYPPDVIVKQANYGLGGGNNLDYDPATDQISYDGTVVETAADMSAAGLYHYDDYIADIAADILDNQPLDGSPAGPGAYGRRQRRQQQAVLRQEADQFGRSRAAQLSVHARPVRIDGLDRDVQLRGDGGIVPTANREVQDQTLSRR